METKKFATEVIGDNLIMLEKRSGEYSNNSNMHPRQQNVDEPEHFDDESIPPLNDLHEGLPF